jgi:transposase
VKGHLLMSAKERERKVVMEAVADKSMTLMEASKRLEISRRQATRIYGRYRQQGDAGLVHASRGRSSNRRKPEALRQQVLARYLEVYEGFGPTLAAEKLAEEGLAVDHETLRRWLLAAGKWKRQRSRKPYRQRRERRARRGELVQVDGSHHRWFGPEGDQCCIMQFIDDATGDRLAIMDGEETTEATMRGLWRWVERHGIPRALYMDRKSVFYTEREPTHEEQLKGETALTQFGKVCRRLGIELIFARSPQAKGRIERAHSVLQDRFVKELALQGIADIDGANALLANGFMDNINKRLACPPKDKRDAHRKVPKGLDLADVFCFEDTRQLNNDWTIRYKNRFYQVHRRQKGPRPKPKDQLAVRTRLDGTLYLAFDNKPLAFEECEPPHKPAPKANASKPAAPKRGGKRKPPPDHPWRKQAINS